MKRALSVLAPAILLAACSGTPVSHQPHARTTAPSYGGRAHSQAFLSSAQHPAGITLPRVAGVPTVAGYDAVTASAIPFGAPAALCYANGAYTNCTAVKARHVTHVITIAVNTSAVARLLDVEPGDATPSQAGPWVKTMIVRYHIWRPGIYADAAEMPAVRASIQAQGLARSAYVLMVADWNGNPTVPVGYDAIQYRSTASLDYDTFLASFLSSPAPPKPRTICWGNRSTPKSVACQRIEAQATSDWKQHLAFARAIPSHTKQEKTVEGRIGALSQNKPKVNVAAWTGPGLDWLNAQLQAETYWSAHFKTLHDKLVKAHTG